MDGILLLKKPKNMTSHDCVNKVRRLFHTKKVGHLGTLDPDVTGILPIAINKGTKIIQFLNQANKEYIAEITLGYSTTTEDASGDIIEKDEHDKFLTRKQIEDVLSSFIGENTQIPPMISAVKVNGKKLYEYARENIEVERPKRTINLFEIELLSQEENFSGKEISFVIRVLCSKGTYIRTLAVDIGKKLGYPAHMSDLIRTKAGQFRFTRSYTFEEIAEDNFQLVSLYDALKQYKIVEVDDEIKEKISHGQKIHYELDNFTFVVFCDIFKQVLAVYQKDPKESHLIKPARVLISE